MIEERRIPERNHNMNTKQLQYAIELAKSRNFSKVAEKLGITQPALSKQVMHLEKELGVKLFDRGTTPVLLTPAGEWFLRQAEELLYREDQIVRTLEEFKTGERGRLEIGISPFRSQYLMPRIVKKIKERYPGVQVVLHEEASDVLRREAAEGKFDFAVVNLPVDESVLDVLPIEADTLVLAVPPNMANRIPQTNGEVDMKDCKDFPFVAVGPTQEMRRLLERSCMEAGFHPKVSVEVVGIRTAWEMVRAGLGIALMPVQFLKEEQKGDVVLFPLTKNLRTRQPVIVTRRDQYISEYARYAMELLSEKSE